MHIGGPFENAEGGIVGTLMIINVANAAEARTFYRQRTYALNLYHKLNSHF